MIVVFGSLNMDVSMPVERLPRPGETVLCPSYVLSPGGKGANQAVAAARAGGKVAMVGCVGDDAFGRMARDNLTGNGVDASCIATVADAPTACAAITVDAAGENAIVVASAANLQASAAQVADAALAPGGTLLLQMEVPVEENWALLRRARAAGARTIVSCAPYRPIPADLLQLIDLLILNALEAESLAEALGLGAGQGAEPVARAIAQASGGACVVTLGGEGALAVEKETLHRVAPLAIEPVDTTGAGDAFCGILAAGLDEGLDLPDALKRANIGAALACLKVGAQAALPTRAAIEARLTS